MLSGHRGDSAREYDIPGLHVVDPEDRGAGTWCYSCDGICEGHYTGKLTAVADENEEIRHWAASESAARRWMQRHRLRYVTISRPGAVIEVQEHRLSDDERRALDFGRKPFGP